jgi:hypothetical protein
VNKGWVEDYAENRKKEKEKGGEGGRKVREREKSNTSAPLCTRAF